MISAKITSPGTGCNPFSSIKHLILDNFLSFKCTVPIYPSGMISSGSTRNSPTTCVRAWSIISITLPSGRLLISGSPSLIISTTTRSPFNAARVCVGLIKKSSNSSSSTDTKPNPLSLA